MTTQNLCEIKSHTSSYANMLPSEKKTKYLTARHQFSQYSGTTPITGISIMQIIIIQNFITAINSRQEKKQKSST